MKFIGRHSELDRLEQEYRNNSSFVVIYGRRRVGKTTLIKEFIKGKNAFYYLASKEVDSLCRKRFSEVIARTTGNPMIGRVQYNDWETLFQLIADYQPEEKKVIVIDEFPYLVKTNSAFPSVLQYIWDELLKDKNIMLILCGSLISMMKKHTMSADSPLYGRRTAQIRLLPLTFTEVYEAQKPMDFCDAVAQYAVIGGVPKYLELFDSRKTLLENIENVVLSKSGFLYEEPNFLFSEEVSAPAGYFSILKAIADGNHKLDRIGNVLSTETSALMPYITTLIELGFVLKDTPITEKNPERSRKGLYFIADPFLRYWFRYVNPFRGELEMDNRQIVFDEMKKDFTEKYVAFAYEDICKNIFSVLCKNGTISFTPSRIGSFWQNDLSGDTQIDVAAVDLQHKTLFLGECKYHKNPVDADVYFTLQEKAQSNREIQQTYPGFRILYGVFSKSDFTKRLYDLAAANEALFLINEDKIVGK